MLEPKDFKDFSEKYPDNRYSWIISELMEQDFDPEEDFDIFDEEFTIARYDGKITQEDDYEVVKYLKKKKK